MRLGVLEKGKRMKNDEPCKGNNRRNIMRGCENNEKNRWQTESFSEVKLKYKDLLIDRWIEVKACKWAVLRVAMTA